MRERRVFESISIRAQRPGRKCIWDFPAVSPILVDSLSAWPPLPQRNTLGYTYFGSSGIPGVIRIYTRVYTFVPLLCFPKMKTVGKISFQFEKKCAMKFFVVGKIQFFSYIRIYKSLSRSVASLHRHLHTIYYNSKRIMDRIKFTESIMNGKCCSNKTNRIRIRVQSEFPWVLSRHQLIPV